MNYIFDFDGTLMDTAPVIVAAMDATVKEMGLPSLGADIYKQSIGLGLEDTFKRLFPDIDGRSKEYADLYVKQFPKFNIPGIAKPFTGVLETLKKLNYKNVPMAVASSRNHGTLDVFLKDMGVFDFFKMITGEGDVQNGKPNPDAVLAILAALGWKAEETMVVGDADVDIKMGKAAGCLTCAVTYGNGSLESLKSASPDYIINSFSEILRK